MTSKYLPVLFVALPIAGVIAATIVYLHLDTSTPNLPSITQPTKLNERSLERTSEEVRSADSDFQQSARRSRSQSETLQILSTRSQPLSHGSLPTLQSSLIGIATQAEESSANSASDDLPPPSAENTGLTSQTHTNTPSLVRPALSTTASTSLSLPNGATLATTTPAKEYLPAVQTLPLPLALQPIDPAALGLNEPQVRVVKALRESFAKDIGGQGQNPYDPAYAERWQEAQPTNDAQLRLFFGTGVANQVALQAAQAENVARQPR